MCNISEVIISLKLISLLQPNPHMANLANEKIQLRYVSGSHTATTLTLRLLVSYIYGAPSKARNANVVYIRTYVWQR